MFYQFNVQEADKEFFVFLQRNKLPENFSISLEMSMGSGWNCSSQGNDFDNFWH